MPGEHGFAVAKKNDLRHQLRSARLVCVRVVNVEAIAQEHAGVEMTHGGTRFRVALVDALLIGGWTVRVRGLSNCRWVRCWAARFRRVVTSWGGPRKGQADFF